MTVTQFVQNMRVLNSHYDNVTVPAFSGNGNCQVYWLQDSSFRMARAYSIPCTFYGGPPRARARYEGTLQTMFLDRLLSAAYNEGFDVFDQFI
jgi:hypothetical protein